MHATQIHHFTLLHPEIFIHYHLYPVPTINSSAIWHWTPNCNHAPTNLAGSSIQNTSAKVYRHSTTTEYQIAVSSKLLSIPYLMIKSVNHIMFDYYQQPPKIHSLWYEQDTWNSNHLTDRMIARTSIQHPLSVSWTPTKKSKKNSRPWKK